MQYKTIILRLIQERPEFHEHLAWARTMLTTLERYADLLKANQEAWIEQLRQRRPGTDEAQLASEAMEIAVKEIESIMPSGLERDEVEMLSLDEAMTFLRERQPQG